MPIYRFKAPDGRTFGLEGDSPPNEQELEAAFAQLPALPKQNIVTAAPTLEQQYIDQQQSNPLQRFATSAKGVGTTIADLVKTLGGGASGVGEVLGQASVPSEEAPSPVSQAVLQALTGFSTPGINPMLQGMGQAIPNIAQSGLEALARGGVDIATVIKDQLQKVALNPASLSLPGQIAQLIPRTPSPEEAIAGGLQLQDAQRQAQEMATLKSAPIAPEILGKANLPLANAMELVSPVAGEAPAIVRGLSAPANATIQAAKNVAQKISSRGILKAPLEDVVTKVTGITAQEGSFDVVPIAKSRILEATNKVPSNAVEAYKAADTTEKYLINKTLSALKTGDEQGLLMSRQQALDNAAAQLKSAQPSISNEEMNAALQPFERRLPATFTPTQGQKFLVEQNDALQTVFQETGVPARKTRGNAAVTTRLGIADSLSNQLDDIYKGVSGLNESPYRDFGQVRDFKQGLNDQIISAQQAQGGKAGKGISSFPVTKFGALAKTGRAVGRPLIPREIEAIDNGVSRIFKEIPSASEIPTLTIQESQALLDKYNPASQPPLIPASAGFSEQQIQDQIKKIPKPFRGNPDLERKIAQSMLANP